MITNDNKHSTCASQLINSQQEDGAPVVKLPEGVVLDGMDRLATVQFFA